MDGGEREGLFRSRNWKSKTEKRNVLIGSFSKLHLLTFDWLFAPALRLH